MINMRRLGSGCSLAIIASTFVAGCVSNNHKAFFVSTVAPVHPLLSDYPKFNLSAFAGEPRVQYRFLTEEEALRMFEDGYVQLGYSSFNGPAANNQDIIAQARRIGAELVFAASQYTNTVSGAVPLTTYSPQTSFHSGSLNGPFGTTTYSGTSTAYTSTTTYMPYSVAKFDQQAAYFTRLLNPPVLGANVRPLTSDERRSTGSNDGVVVRYCVKGSPSWKAFVPGDTLLSLNSEKIDSPERLIELLKKNVGNSVKIEFLRSGKKQSVDIQLGPVPTSGT